MALIDYAREPRSDIAFIDMKSFYASVECVQRGLDPLRTSLCVMSRSDNSKGLILAASPTFKEVFGAKNVGRGYDLPFDPVTRRFNYQLARRKGWSLEPDYIAFVEGWARQTLIVPPRMSLYIEENMKIQEVLETFAPKEDILPYSIDEAFMDVSQSLNYFVPGDPANRRQKLDQVSSMIQQAILDATGVPSSIGMSNANPLLAKLALDNEAKKAASLRANWSYKEVETKVWKIPKLTDFWGIGQRMEARLETLGIHSIYDLAHSNPDRLKQEFGVMGLQLWFHAHGVDESQVREPYQAQGKGMGNSQILPKDYYDREDIELVLSEMAEQVAIRLRRSKQKATCVSIHVGYARDVDRRPIQAQRRVDPTQRTRVLVGHVLALFRQHYDFGPVRRIGVRYTGLVDESLSLVSLLEDYDLAEKEVALEKTIDAIRQRFGFLSLQKATVLKENSRFMARSKLIGGHAAGGAGGLDGLA